MADHALYLEVDEDITSAIDKLRKAPGPSVQIVVPKRSGILQSVINLKLLKKAATDAGKELVLITNDKVAGDLAGRIGIPVAATLGANPVVHEAIRVAPNNDVDEIIEADDTAPDENMIDLEDKPVDRSGRSSRGDAVPINKPSFNQRDIDKATAAIAIPVAADVAAEAEAANDEALIPTKPIAKGASKVPSFTKLQRRIAWAGLTALLIVGYLVAMYFFSSATVKLYAIGTRVNVDGAFSADTTAAKSDAASGVLTAQEVTFSKDASTPVTPTGQKDNGTPATGTVVFTNCEDSNAYPFAAGNIITSQGLSFTTNEAITIPAGTFTGGGKNCTSPSVSVAVTAAKNGDSYNLTNASFSSPKLTSNFKITASQMSGGTSKIVTVLTQADVDKAQATLLAADKDSSTAALNAKVPSDSMALADSVSQDASVVTPNPAVGAEATTATMSLKINYTVLTVKKSDFKAWVDGLETKQIGDKSQIYDDGIGAAKISTNGKDAAGRPSFSFSALAYAGTKLDTQAIAKQLKGQKYGEAASLAGALPGVDHVEINVWPAWATSLPMRPTQIHVTVSVASNKG